MITPSRARASLLCLILGGALLAVPACGGDGGAAATQQSNGGSAGSASGGGAGGPAGNKSGGAAGAGAGAGTSAKGGSAGTGAGGGGSAGSAGSAGSKSGGAAGAGPNGPGSTCAVDSDCGLGAAEASPAGCAEPFCKISVCALRAVDGDGDGFRTKKCKLVSDGAFTVELGADCDDASKETNPKSWDGPAGEGNPDRCGDGVDQDCSGADGDAVLSNGGSCSCAPGDTEKCGQTAGGSPIDYPGGKPAPNSECKLGDRTCVVDLVSGGGKWGPCTGAQGPSVEVCNGGSTKDEDCDGQADEADADGKLEWVYDGDGDGSRASLPNADPTKPRVPFASIQACAKPTGTPPECTAAFCGATPIATCCPPDRWRLANTATSFDCDDSDNFVAPGLPEICAVLSGSGAKDKDDNCNGEKDEVPAVGASLWFYDADNDGFGDTATVPKTSCAAPGPGWKTAIPNTDCNDAEVAISPGVAENCANQIDDNCNGSTRDGCPCVDGDLPKDCGAEGSCVFIAGGSTCVNGTYTLCPAPIDKQEYCPDADGDKACALDKCGQYCPSVLGTGGEAIPSGYVKRDTCDAASDCNDATAGQSPRLPELCGDAIDNDCDGTQDNGFFVGDDCDVGGAVFGACLKGGKWVCNGPNQTKCEPQGWTPTADPQDTAAPNGSFDWNCDGLVSSKIQENKPVSGPSSACLKTVEQMSEAAFCVSTHKKTATPYSWKDSAQKCVEPALGPGESIPTCAELTVGTSCFTHYYFTECRDEVLFGPGNITISCKNPCGKEIAALECAPSADQSKCEPTGGFAPCGPPYILCR